MRIAGHLLLYRCLANMNDKKIYNFKRKSTLMGGDETAINGFSHDYPGKKPCCSS